MDRYSFGQILARLLHHTVVRRKQVSLARTVATIIASLSVLDRISEKIAYAYQSNACTNQNERIPCLVHSGFLLEWGGADYSAANHWAAVSCRCFFAYPYRGVIHNQTKCSYSGETQESFHMVFRRTQDYLSKRRVVCSVCAKVRTRTSVDS